MMGCAAVEPSAFMLAGVSTSNHSSASTDSSPLPFPSTSDWLPSSWTFYFVVGVLCLVPSVSFSSPTPSHSICISGACFGAEVYGVTAPMVSLLSTTSCSGMCRSLYPPAWRDLSSSACISLFLSGSLSSLSLCTVPAPLIPPLPALPCASRSLYSPMKWWWHCALSLLLSDSSGMFSGNDPFHGICSASSVYCSKTLAPYVRL